MYTYKNAVQICYIFKLPLNILLFIVVIKCTGLLLCQEVIWFIIKKFFITFFLYFKPSTQVNNLIIVNKAYKLTRNGGLALSISWKQGGIREIFFLFLFAFIYLFSLRVISVNGIAKLRALITLHNL